VRLDQLHVVLEGGDAVLEGAEPEVDELRLLIEPVVDAVVLEAEASIDPVEASVDLVEASIDLLEASVDLLEASQRLRAEAVEPLVEVAQRVDLKAEERGDHGPDLWVVQDLHAPSMEQAGIVAQRSCRDKPTSAGC
jgi:hypothetical protein